MYANIKDNITSEVRYIIERSLHEDCEARRLLFSSFINRIFTDEF